MENIKNVAGKLEDFRGYGCVSLGKKRKNGKIPTCNDSLWRHVCMEWNIYEQCIRIIWIAKYMSYVLAGVGYYVSEIYGKDEGIR